MMAELFHVGVPIALAYVFESGLFFISALLMGLVSTAALAAHNAVVNVCSISFMIPYALSQAATVRVGYAIGAQRPEAARMAGYVAIGLGVCWMLLAAFTTALAIGCALFTDATWVHDLFEVASYGAWYGVILDNAVGATVRNCRVTKFRRGIRLRSGHGNLIQGNEVFGCRYGIELGAASTTNRILGNSVHDSRDEGIHVGEASNGNWLEANEVRRSKRENLYLLNVKGCTVVGNTLAESKKVPLYIKHSQGNHIVGNDTADGPIHLRGASVSNVLENNHLRGWGYLFEAYEEMAPDGTSAGWLYPHGNTVTGGVIDLTRYCFRFFGAYDNTATGVGSRGCTPAVMLPLGGRDSTGNVVGLVPAQ